MNEKIPAVSVIIPMYNSAKYIGACLDSILAQTLKDFEIIITDDCSTDNSRTIVENYMKNIGGGVIKLLRRKKNSGGCAIPRNDAILLARGKYIQFVDSDDMMTSTMLEELYQLAEEYKPDIVYTQQYFAVGDVNVDERTLTPANPYGMVDKPSFETDDPAERIMNLVKGKYIIGPMQYFSRRDFLMENNIFLPKVLVSEDDFWIMKIICSNARILCVPNILYLNRLNPNSLTFAKKTVPQHMKYYLSPTIPGMKIMSEIFNDSEFLQQNPQYWYAWVSRIVNYNFSMIFQDCANLQPHEVYRIVKEQFAQDTGEHSDLIAYLCSMINTQQKQLYLAGQRISELERKFSGN
ncbi:MAG: glycosyltransferase family 2 protein [Selenomonadaceae bacterium]|nr:glycosyltransferase family 2 protein [Selenomonadaceae bacterium]